MAQEELVAVLRAELAQFRQGMDEAVRLVQDAGSKIRQSTEQASQGFAGMEKALSAAKAGLAAFGVTVGIGAVVKLGTDAVQAALKMESLTNALKVVTGSAGAAQNALEFVRGTANRLGQDLTETGNAFTKFSAAARGTSLEGEATRRLFTQVSEASRVLGLSVSDTNGIFLALSQSISKGTIQSEELRGQIGERLPGAFQIAARAMGVSTAELGKLLESGKVLAEDLLPRLGNQLQKELGSGAEAASRSAAASFQRLVNEVKELSIALGQGIISGLQPAIDFATKSLAAFRGLREQQAANLAAATGPTPAPLPTDITASNITPQAEAIRKQILEAQDRIAKGQEFLSRTGIRAPSPAIAEDIQANLEKERLKVEELTKTYDGLLKQLDKVREGFSADGQDRGPIPFAKQTTELGKLVEAMRKDLKAIEVESSLFGEKDQEGSLEKAKQQLKEIEKTTGDITKTLLQTPGALDAQVPGIQKIVKEIQGELAARRATIKAIEDAKEAQTEAEREVEQAARAREREDKQFAETRVDLFAKAAKAEQEQAEAVAKASFEEVKARATALAAQEEYNQAQEEALRRLDQLEARSVSLFEGRRERLRQQVQDYENAFGATERSATVLAKGLAKIDQDETAHNAAELKKQNKDYEQFADGVRRTLSDKLFDILSGKVESFKDLLGSIKDTFFRVLADMVAAAAVSGLFGTSGGTSFLSVLTGNRGTSPITGADTGGGSTVGSLFQGAGYAKQVYSLYTSLFGGGTAAASAVAPTLTAAQISAGQAILGGTTPAAFYATSEAAAAPTFGGGASFAATAAPIVAGAGYGIGTGLLASQLLSLAGLHGTANTTLAGAAGGAVFGAASATAVGAAIGTAITPVIGTIIGAAIGAIGGAIAGFLGKEPAPPGFTAPAGSGTVPQFSTNQLGQVIQTTGFRPQVGGAALSAQGLQTIQNALHDVTNQVINPVIDTLRQFPKEFQYRATEQLNALGESLKTGLGTIKFSGEDFAEQFKAYLEKDLPEAVHRTFDPFVALLNQLKPVFDGAQQLLQALQQQQAQILGTIGGVRANLEEAGLSNLAIFKRRRQQLSDLLSQFTPETPENQRVVLGGQITSLVNALGQQGTQLFRAAGDDEGLRFFKQGLFDALNQVEQDTRNVFGSAQQQAKEQIEILTGSLSAQQSMESLLEGVNVRLEQIAQLLAPVGSFETTIGQVKRIPRTGLALVHEGELIGRPVAGGNSIVVNVDARGATDPGAVGRTTASAIRSQLRAMQQASRYRQDGSV